MKTTIVISEPRFQDPESSLLMLEEEQLEYSDDDNDSASPHLSFVPEEEPGEQLGAYSSRAGHVLAQQDDDDDDDDDDIVQKRALPIPITRELKIDELDILDKDTGLNTKRNKKDTASRSPIRKQLGLVKKNYNASRSNPSTVESLSYSSSSMDNHVPCPCCKAYVRCKDHKKTNNLIASARNDDRHAGHEKSSFTALIESFFWPGGVVEGNSPHHTKGNTVNTGDEDDDDDDKNEGEGVSLSRNHTTEKDDADNKQENMIHTDFQYTVVRCLVESWLHKKGSGKDVFGSTSWKPRWCQLVLAEVQGYSGHVPLLLASWHSSMPKPSTIIVLDQKIAIAIDALGVSSSGQETGKHSNEGCYRFDIASSDHNKDPMSLVTRTFSAASMDLRNDWVQKMNDTICTYERYKKSMALKHVTSKLPPISPRTKSQSREYSQLEGLDLVY